MASPRIPQDIALMGHATRIPKVKRMATCTWRKHVTLFYSHSCPPVKAARGAAANFVSAPTLIIGASKAARRYEAQQKATTKEQKARASVPFQAFRSSAI